MESQIQRLCCLSEIRSLSNEIEKAVSIVINYLHKEKLSIRKIAKHFKITRSKLLRSVWNNLNGFPLNDISRTRLLNTWEEDYLADLIRQKESELQAMTIEEVCEEVNLFYYYLIVQAWKIATKRLNETETQMKKISNQNFVKVHKPTSGWFQKFKARHNLKTRVAETLEPERRDFGTSGTLSEWFDGTYIKYLPKKMDPRLLFNFDEIMIGGGRRLSVVVRSEAKRAIRTEITKIEHITCGLLISASGDSWVPYLILNRKTLPKELQQLVDNKQIYIGGQQSGWMTKETFYDWTIQFVQYVKKIRKEFKLDDHDAVLLVDSHESREKFDTLELLKKNNIKVITFPSHTTHIVQPIDRSIAFPFKQELTRLFRKYQNLSISFSDSSDLTKTEKTRFLQSLAIIDAAKRACTFINIQNGFRICGLYPPSKETLLNNQRIRKDDTNMELIIQKKYPNRIRISGKCITNETFMKQIKEKEEKNGEKKTSKRTSTKNLVNQSSKRKKKKSEETKIEKITPFKPLPSIIPKPLITASQIQNPPSFLSMVKIIQNENNNLNEISVNQFHV